MKKASLYILISLWGMMQLPAQSTMQAILIEVENNNKTLKAARQSADLQKIDARTGIYLPNPSVEYERLWGNRASDNTIENELTVAQEFDFPTAYVQRNKIVSLKDGQAESQYKAARQNVLLEVKQLCIQMVYLNKAKAILDERLKNAEELNRSYQKRLETGDANVLETNKIALELLNVEAEQRMNDSERRNCLIKLKELNGDADVVFTDKAYIDVDPMSINMQAILQKSIETNPELKTLEQQKAIAERSVSLAKSLGLPKFNLGYKMSFSGPEKFYGFVAGLSIPLWENKNTVKRAKTEATLTGMEIDNTRLIQTNEIRQLYDKMLVLRESMRKFSLLLSNQNNEELLKKALSLGQISLLEYLTESNFLYQSVENFLQTEKDYHTTLAELLKAEL